DLPKDDDIGRNAGFIKRMEWGDGKLFRKVKPNCIDPHVVMRECESWGVNVQTVCTVPVLFNYHLDPTSGIEWSRFLNDSLAGQVGMYPRRMVALGTLPLQHPEEAAKEMKRAVMEKGMRGFQIGSHINSWTPKGGIENIMLNDKRLMPIWHTAK
ncbi:2-amino-3-carboxymuconate-6-semialdehyde decarboxylase, putative, partial [Perkinsus marinus ATCC 50983]